MTQLKLIEKLTYHFFKDDHYHFFKDDHWKMIMSFRKIMIKLKLIEKLAYLFVAKFLS